LIAPDAVAYDPVYPEPLRGKTAIMKDLDASFAALPDVHYEILKPLAKDRDAAIEFRITGTYRVHRWIFRIYSSHQQKG
jgi:hypothetical protein